MRSRPMPQLRGQHRPLEPLDAVTVARDQPAASRVEKPVGVVKRLCSFDRIDQRQHAGIVGITAQSGNKASLARTRYCDRLARGLFCQA